MLVWLRHRFLLVQQLLFAGHHTLLRRFTGKTCTTGTTAGLASRRYTVPRLQLSGKLSRSSWQCWTFVVLQTKQSRSYEAPYDAYDQPSQPTNTEEIFTPSSPVSPKAARHATLSSARSGPTRADRTPLTGTANGYICSDVSTPLPPVKSLSNQFPSCLQTKSLPMTAMSHPHRLCSSVHTLPPAVLPLL